MVAPKAIHRPITSPGSRPPPYMGRKKGCPEYEASPPGDGPRKRALACNSREGFPFIVQLPQNVMRGLIKCVCRTHMSHLVPLGLN